MSQKQPAPQPGILEIDPYIPGASHLPSGRTPIKLSSNETPLGPSPAALQAYRDAADALERYPDGQATKLREAIAQVHGLKADQIICGAGSDELLNLLAAAYLGPGDEAIYSEHGFLVYRIAILANGATPVIAPEIDLTTDVDAILARVTPKTRMVFIANPNNPTGSVLPAAEVERLRAGLPDDIILVLDGAYAEYVEGDDYTDGAELVERTNTVMTRTFSKIHGLAALRLGWAYAPPPMIDVMNRIRGPFNVGSPALAAGEAAVRDTAHVESAILHNSKWLPRLTEEITRLGLTVTPSVANFVLIHVPNRLGRSAADLDAYLKSQAILLRRVTGYGFPDALRMSIGTDQENETVGLFGLAIKTIRVFGVTRANMASTS
ncbi:MAG: histidinol-phosphate transaminase, partial [Pseudomonadota bacterium]